MADEAPTLQQYSKQLNVYNGDLSDRGRLSVNISDQFEISYKTGTGYVVVRNLLYQDGDLPENIHNLGDEMYNINVKADTNRATAEQANGVVAAAVVTERVRAQAEEKKSSDGLASEVSARTSAVSSVASALAQEVADRIGAVSTLTNSIANEATSRGAADGVHTSAIASNASAITSEAKRADDEEKRIVGLITTEASARVAEGIEIMGDVVGYNGRALTAEAGLQTALNAEVTARGLALNAAQSGAATALGVESARAEAAEAALTVRINSVLSNITPAAIDSFTEVVTALNASGGSLTTAVNNEATRALAIEGSLQTQINALLAAVLALQAPY